MKVFLPNPNWLYNTSQIIDSIARRNDIGGYDMNCFESPILFNILNQRLMNHIVSCKLPNNKGFGHWVWKWQFSNLKIAAAILKLTGIILPDEYLSCRSTEECLLRQDAQSITELIDANNGGEMGAYLYLFCPENGIIQEWRRAGSAAVGMKKRGDEHIRNSKQKCERNRESLFYRTFPHKDSALERTSDFLGYFTDLEHRVGVSFKRDHMLNVQNLFQWTEYTESCIETSKLNLPIEEKKHRLVCYLFETVLQLCLDVRLNVSQSQGNECSLGYCPALQY